MFANTNHTHQLVLKTTVIFLVLVSLFFPAGAQVYKTAANGARYYEKDGKYFFVGNRKFLSNTRIDSSSELNSAGGAIRLVRNIVASTVYRVSNPDAVIVLNIPTSRLICRYGSSNIIAEAANGDSTVTTIILTNSNSEPVEFTFVGILFRLSGFTTNDRSIPVNTSGGTPLHTYSLGLVNFQRINVFNNLYPGSFTFYSKDANECTTQKNLAIVLVSNLTLTTLPKVIIYEGKQVQVTVKTNEIKFKWIPSHTLNSSFMVNPTTFTNVTTLNRDITYFVIAFLQEGCKGFNIIKISVFEKPEILLSSGFTANNDGMNDVLKPALVGIKYFHFFKVLNRWNQIVFYSDTDNHGWNGISRSLKRANDSFTWITTGTGYKGNLIK